MSTPANSLVTPEEYLERERKAEYKSQYHNGKVYAMPGARRTHERISAQLHGLIDRHLSDGKCESFTSDMRVVAQPRGLCTYPDLSAACGEPQFADDYFDTLLSPILLVEILSPSTEDYDRLFISAAGLDASIELQSIGYTLRLSELYKRAIAAER